MTKEEKEKIKEAYIALDKVCNNSKMREEIIKDTLKEVFSKVKGTLRHITHEIWALKRENFCSLAQLDYKLSKCLDDIEQEFLKGE